MDLDFCKADRERVLKYAFCASLIAATKLKKTRAFIFSQLLIPNISSMTGWYCLRSSSLISGVRALAKLTPLQKARESA